MGIWMAVLLLLAPDASSRTSTYDAPIAKDRGMGSLPVQLFPPSIREEVEIPTWAGVLTCQTASFRV